MRPVVAALISSLLLAGTAQAAPAYPDTTNPKGRAYPVRALLKLSRGLVNVGFFWLEPVTNPIKEGWRIENAGGNTVAVTAGMFTGVFSGATYAVVRMGSGVLDVASFPIPTPPLMNPETPFGLFETLGTDDSEHRLTRTTQAHRIEPEPLRRPAVDHGL